MTNNLKKIMVKRTVQKLPDKYEVWNLFHDGCIIQINGSLPNLSLTIQIPYLASFVSKGSNAIVAKINNCTFVGYLDWGSRKKIRDIDGIASRKLEILSSEEVDGRVSILCTEGELIIAYQDISFALDGGKEISIKEIDLASEKYWANWRERN